MTDQGKDEADLLAAAIKVQQLMNNLKVHIETEEIWTPLSPMGAPTTAIYLVDLNSNKERLS